MSLNRHTVKTLQSEAGRATLDRLAESDLHEDHTLAWLTDLRREWPPEVAGAALTLARLRKRAAAKFSRADVMWFTPDALEQASGETVSAWRAGRLAQTGCVRLADLGCGIGGDTLALGAKIPDATVVAIDRDLLRLHMARLNLAAYGLDNAHVVQADLTCSLPLDGIQAAFFDPARRVEGRRIFSVRDYIPPLDLLHTWTFGAWAVKLSPGVDLDELRPYTGAGAGIEFVSVDGELKEAVLWGGALGFAGRWAVALDGDISVGVGLALRRIPQGVSLQDERLAPPPLSAPRAYLYELDPAVIRAGLFGELAADMRLDLYRLDPQIAYLTADDYVESRWVRAWPVLDWLPFNLKRLRALLRERGIGRVTVKKRGSPLTPEALIRKLKLRGDGDSAVVVLTQVDGQHSAILCGECVKNP